MSDVFGPVVEALCARLRDTTGDERVRVEPLQRWHRRFSDLMRARLEGVNPPRVVYVKIVRPRTPAECEKTRHRLERDAVTSARLVASLPPPFRVAVPVAWFPDLLAIVTEEAPGVPLAQVLARALLLRRDAPATLAASLFQVGRWVAAFQAALPAEGEERAEDLAGYLDIRLEKLRASRSGCTDRDCEAIRATFAEAAGRLAATPGGLARATVHADLAPGNVLLDGAGVTVLDLAMVRTGLRLHDVAHLWVQLDVMTAKPWFRPRAVASLQAALLRGYDERVAPTDPAFVCCRLLNQVNHFAATAVRAAPWMSRPYDRHVMRRHLATLRQLAGRA